MVRSAEPGARGGVTEGVHVVGATPEAQVDALIAGGAAIVADLGVTRLADPRGHLTAWLPPGLDPLDRIALAQHLVAAARDVVAVEVERARAAGSTWEQIGGVLGVSRQAAHERFAPGPTG